MFYLNKGRVKEQAVKATESLGLDVRLENNQSFLSAVVSISSSDSKHNCCVSAVLF